MSGIIINNDNYIYDKWMVGGSVLAATQQMAAEYAAQHPLQINPAKHAEKVGDLVVNGHEKQLFLKHAGDVLAFDPDNGTVLLITRKDPPGAGKFATPGGMFDPRASGEATETLARVIDKESGEEVGDRIRTALTELSPIAVQERRLITTDHRERGRSNDGEILVGDIIAMTSSGVVYSTPGLSKVMPEAGDDATSAGFFALADLDEKDFSLREHCQMIREGAEAAGLDSLLPAAFGQVAQQAPTASAQVGYPQRTGVATTGQQPQLG